MTDLEAAVRTVPDFPQPGIQFKDLTPLMADAVLFARGVERLAAPWAEEGVTHVLAIESRGYWFGGALAQRLGAGMIPAQEAGQAASGGAERDVRAGIR